MPELKPNKRPTRDYSSYCETGWEFLDTVYARRSNRKFAAEDLSGRTASDLEGLMGLAIRTRGAAEGSLVTVCDPRAAEAMKRLVYSGITNKINLWLARTPVSGFLCIVVPSADAGADRPVILPEAVVAAEDCVLWLTQEGLGSCWLAGVNSDAVAEELGLTGDMTVPAVVVFGRPKHGAGGYDALTNRTMSRKRKPLQSISHAETFDRPYELPDPGDECFEAADFQNIDGLLRGLKTGETGGRPPGIDFAVEICLESARVAPNGGNLQKWEFVVVREPERLEALRKACGGGGGDWKAAIIGAGKSKRIETALLDKPLWVIDLPIALSHISLMACSIGLRPDLCISSMDESRVAALVGASGGLRPVGLVGLRWP